MGKMFKVEFKGLIEKEFEENTTFLEISKQFQKYFNFPILVANVNNKITDLNEKITKKCDIDFYDRSSSIGNSIYGRCVSFIMILAVKRLLGKNVDVRIEHSIDKGFYCELDYENVDKNLIKDIEKEMRVIVKEDLKFTKLSVPRLDAISFFKKEKSLDKVNVLKYISNTYVNLYRLDDLYDYFYSEMAYSTKDIDEFKLTYVKGNGFVVNYPNVYVPDYTYDYVHHPMMFDAYFKYTKWGERQGISNAADLNKVVSEGRTDEIIRLAETAYNNQLANVAEEIAKNKKIKLVLIAGPSSSGKTTSAQKLAIHLKCEGVVPHQISIDDYFVDKKNTPLDENGEPDFESLNTVDVELFNKHLLKLLDGEKVLLPQYNFKLGKREYKNKWLQLKEGEVIIIEGLHALNDNLIMSVDRQNKYKIYISPLTQLNIDDHNRIHTSDTRRLRRIVRDNKYRNFSAAETLKMWSKIRAGEEKNIFPFQDDADVVVNSALLYEIGVLKTYVEPLLFSVPENDEVYHEALRLINFLRNFLPIPSDSVPSDSVLREFIGGSCFRD